MKLIFYEFADSAIEVGHLDEESATAIAEISGSKDLLVKCAELYDDGIVDDGSDR